MTQGVHIVVEIHGDGDVTVYGPKGTRAVVVNRPWVDERRTILSDLCDTVVHEALAGPYRSVYRDGRVIGRGLHRAVDPWAVLETMDDIELLGCIGSPATLKPRDVLAMRLGVVRW